MPGFESPLNPKPINPKPCVQGPYKFLSNFFWSQLDYEGLCYPSVEHAFQAAKLRRNEETALNPLSDRAENLVGLPRGP